jgi:hypothetical protein
VSDLYIRDEEGRFASPWTGLPLIPSPADIEFLIGYLADHGYTVVRADPDATFRVSRRHPGTSKAISDKVADGTMQAEALTLIREWGGLTDDELETRMGRTHQSVSATRNTLMRKGKVADSGLRRKTRSGNDAIVWVAT